MLRSQARRRAMRLPDCLTAWDLVAKAGAGVHHRAFLQMDARFARESPGWSLLRLRWAHAATATRLSVPEDECEKGSGRGQNGVGTRALVCGGEVRLKVEVAK